MRLHVPSLGLVMGQHKQPGYHTHGHVSLPVTATVPRGRLLPTLVLGGGCCTPHPRVLALRPSRDLQTLINGSKTQGFFSKSQCVTSTRGPRNPVGSGTDGGQSGLPVTVPSRHPRVHGRVTLQYKPPQNQGTGTALLVRTPQKTPPGGHPVPSHVTLRGSGTACGSSCGSGRAPAAPASSR